MANLKNYKTYQINRHINKPVMLWGLPFNLFFIYLGFLIAGIFTGMILNAAKVSVIICIIVACIIIFGGGTGVKIFYNKYGLRGFPQQQRDFSLPSQLKADKSVNEILRQKKK